MVEGERGNREIIVCNERKYNNIHVISIYLDMIFAYKLTITKRTVVLMHKAGIPTATCTTTTGTPNYCLTHGHAVV